MIVNREAIGGSHCAKVKTAVEAANTSILSLVSSIIFNPFYFLFNGTVVTALNTTIHPAITEPMTA